MPGPRPTTFLVDFLRSLSSGSLTVDVAGDRFVSLDADRKDVAVRVEPILRTTYPESPTPHAPPMGLRESIGLAGALAHAGWRVDVSREGHTVVSMGRGHSALTGHLSGDPIALWRLRKAL
jgi:hypothetical protein